jgi:hypothetical protein
MPPHVATSTAGVNQTADAGAVPGPAGGGESHMAPSW